VTLSCLAALHSSATEAGVALDAIVVDDGSTDGTAAAVAARFPWASIVLGDGTLFWNRGMHCGIQHALATSVASHLLWLNDDTQLFHDAVGRLLDASSALRDRYGGDGIVVGATADHITGQLTYGGSIAVSRWRPFTFRKVFSETELLACDAMNGNAVLLPMNLVRRVGNLDPSFEHAMGDIDYALRARQQGYPVCVAPGFIGRCANNSLEGGFRDLSLPLHRRWRLLVHPKGVPPKSWWVLTRRHGGLLWPLYFVSPYLTFAVRAVWPPRRTAG
jgi:GT2 family glycosyltransferase